MAPELGLECPCANCITPDFHVERARDVLTTVLTESPGFDRIASCESSDHRGANRILDRGMRVCRLTL